ncbi:MAG: radical SAM protein [Arcobacteraceae bacterium]|nr:radical SAM protein [Arcobacteraceae bacterium]
MLIYNYPLFRPPAEASNIIIQVTYGCSYNNCSFCSMYKSKSYKPKELKDIFQDIDTLSSYYPNSTKIFLADGDALALDTSYLLKILKYLQKSFKKLRRVSLYGSAQNILSKTKDELDMLQQHKLMLVYYGIETGSDIVLNKITKGVSQDEIITSLNMLSNSNIKISSTVILGIGGKNYSTEHIKQTANIINNTTVNYLSTLQLGLEDNVIDKFYRYFDDFIPLSDTEILDEQKLFIELLNPINKIIFRSNHASNALHLAGNIPKDKDKLVLEIEDALKIANDTFVPEVSEGF